MPRTACFAAVITIVCLTLVSQPARSQWPDIPAVDLSKVKPSDFTDNELDIPYYLAHFHTFANSVTETGPGCTRLLRERSAHFRPMPSCTVPKAALKETALKSGIQRVVALNMECSDKLGYSFTL